MTSLKVWEETIFGTGLLVTLKNVVNKKAKVEDFEVKLECLKLSGIAPERVSRFEKILQNLKSK